MDCDVWQNLKECIGISQKRLGIDTQAAMQNKCLLFSWAIFVEYWFHTFFLNTIQPKSPLSFWAQYAIEILELFEPKLMILLYSFIRYYEKS